MEELLFKKIPSILLAETKSVKWHFNSKCQGCSFEEHCRKTTVMEGNLSNIPHISRADHSFLSTVVSLIPTLPAVNAVSDIEGQTPLNTLHVLLSSKPLLDAIKIKFPTTYSKMVKILRAVKHEEVLASPWLRSYVERPPSPFMLNKPYLMLPSFEEVPIFFNCLVDPRTDCLVAYSIASPMAERTVHGVAPSRDHDMVPLPFICPRLTPADCSIRA